MLNRIIALSLKNRLLVLAGSLLLALYGAWVAIETPVDVLPDLNRPTVTVMAEAHGMIPEDVERLVTRPLEQHLGGATGVTRIRSASGRELAIVHVEFGWGTDIYRNRQVVQEKLQLARELLPADVQPQMAPISSIMGQIQLIGVRSRSGSLDATALRRITDLEIRPRLRSIGGVAQTVVIGGSPAELQVTLDAASLRAHEVTVQDVEEAVRASNVNAAGGMLPTGWKAPLVAVSGRLTGPAGLAEAVVRADPVRPVRLRDVATVEFGPSAVRTGEAGVDGGPGVIIVIFKQPSVDTTDLTNRVVKEVEAIRSTIDPDVEIVDDIFQQAAFIDRSITNVEDAVRDGAILVVIVLFLFLLNVRTTFITLTAIPMSIAITAIVFRAFDLTINTMTLGGLAVAIGALVDDAIVDVENVFRRLSENAKSAAPRSLLRVVFHASSEVRNPILIGTLLVVVVYIPLFFLTGMEGRLFTPIGLAYIISTLASLAVSLTLTPVLCHLLLGRPGGGHRSGDAWLVRHLKRLTGHAIRFSMKFTLPLCGLLGAAVISGLFVLATRGSEFLPAFNEGTAQINLILPPDAGLEASDAYGRRMETIVRGVEGVKRIGRRTGRGEGDEHAEGVNFTEAIITFDPASRRSREEIIEEIRDRLAAEMPGITTAVEQPLAHLLSHLLSGVNAQVAIKVSGPDLQVLRSTAKEIEAALKPITGVRDLYVEAQTLVEQIEVIPNRDRAAAAGLTMETIGSTVELALAGEALSRMSDATTSVPIVVRLAARDRRDIESIRALPLRAADGSTLSLSDVAEVRLGRTPNTIQREDGTRRIVVQHNIGGRSLGEVVADVERALVPIRARLARQPGYSIRVSGQFEAQAQATRRIFLLSFVALAAMILILFAHFRSGNMMMQVLLSIPLAFVGASAWVVLTGQTLSVATLVGLISLAGIASRNTILLLDHYLHLMREEGEGFTPEMIIRAGQERMVPMLMTALCSGIALVPLALSPDKPGRELLYPVATVILGGLISATVAEFLVHPGVFWMFGRRAAERLAVTKHTDRDAEAVFTAMFPEETGATAHTPEPPASKGDGDA
ncbi:MAG: efflux RND transporter permease subunit [Candidatus Brocadiae bacterium]|nr:efflux RND transporter permease subunit [Candidatus Brocadiia bacterium]